MAQCLGENGSSDREKSVLGLGGMWFFGVGGPWKGRPLMEVMGREPGRLPERELSHGRRSLR